MFVRIKEKDWENIPLYLTFDAYVDQIGLRYFSDTVYKVIDKQLFFLSVIKYGFEFTELKC